MERSQTLTMLDTILPRRRALVEVAVILGFMLLTAASAQVSFWIGPVPVTGQTFAVLFAGALLGSRRAAISQIGYLSVGLTGVPFWFAPGGAPGIARLLGPTGGYLLGFIAAAFVVGWLAERGWGRGIWTAALAMLVGEGMIYAFGLAWLGYYVPGDKIFAAGLYPFVLGDLVKLVFAALALPASWHLLNRLKTLGN